MRFGSVCSGIEAASVAWGPLGWKAAWLAEIEKFPAAVLAHHYPEVPNLGDMTALPARIAAGEVEAPDIFCGGTPCQAFSIAGLRKSLDDARGNLSLVFCEIANAIDTARSVCGRPPAVIFWENVPGVLSTKDNAFGCFLAGLSGEDDPLVAPGGRWTNAGCVSGPQRTVAWRVLDAQYFGVAQRRRRVFVVASARKGFDPATVLFEWDGVRRDTAPSREAREVAPTIPARSTAGGGLGTDFDCDGGTICVATGQAGAEIGAEIGADMAPTLNCNHEAPYVARTLLGKSNCSHAEDKETYVCFDASEDGTGRGTPPRPVAYGIRTANTSSNGWGIQEECTHTLDCAQGVAVAFQERGRTDGPSLEIGGDVAYALTAPNGGGRAQERNVLTPAMQVRRLTPTEAEKLQGFPDGYTAIPWRKKPASECPDGPRYKSLGNSWAVPNVRWIGERIQRHLAGDL